MTKTIRTNGTSDKRAALIIAADGEPYLRTNGDDILIACWTTDRGDGYATIPDAADALDLTVADLVADLRAELPDGDFAADLDSFE